MSEKEALDKLMSLKNSCQLLGTNYGGLSPYYDCTFREIKEMLEEDILSDQVLGRVSPIIAAKILHTLNGIFDKYLIT